MYPSRTSLLGAKRKKWTVNYNRNGHVKIKKWIVEDDFDIELRFLLNAESSINAMTLGLSEKKNTYGFFHDVLNHLLISQFMTTEGGLSKISSSDFIDTHVVRSVRFSRRDKTCSFYVNGELIGNSYISGMFCIDILGAGSGENGTSPWCGVIFDIKLTDLSNAKNTRYYSSIIRSNCVPISKYLLDNLNQWRSNFWAPNFKNGGIHIEKWNAGKEGGIISFYFKIIESQTSYTPFIDSEPLNNRTYIILDVNTKKMLFTENTIESIQIDGVQQKNNTFLPESNVLYHLVAVIKRNGIADTLGAHYKGNTINNTIMYDVRLTSDSDPRHYPCKIISDTKPTDINVIDVISGKNGVFKTNTRLSPVWTNELSTDGEIVGLGENAWTEM